MVLTDGLASYPLAAGDDYIHRSTSVKGSGMDAHGETVLNFLTLASQNNFSGVLCHS
jgi:hypothetical protein